MVGVWISGLLGLSGEFRGSLLLNMDRIFLKAMIYVLYHQIANN